jgi:uncharacterized LabA/DUF88 family protein
VNGKQKRIAIFIDGSNFYNGSKMVLGKTAVNFQTFGVILLNYVKREFPELFPEASFEIIYYNSLIDPQFDASGYERQNSFLQRLRQTPQLTLKLKRLLYEKVGGSEKYCAEEKGVDLQIAMDMITKAKSDEYDLAILVSGNGDFAETIEYVKGSGKKVYVAFFQKILGTAVRETADHTIILTKKMLEPALLS